MPEAEQKKIEKILHGANRNESLFLNSVIDEKYYFEKPESSDGDGIEMEKGVLNIPVSLVSDETKIKVKVGTGMSAVVADDWQLKKVERKTKGDITTFIAQYTSKKADKAAYNDGMKIAAEIDSIDDKDCQPIKVNFKTKKEKRLMFNDYKFERTD